MKTVALIPIKLNNERLPGKNTKVLCNGKPLISCLLDTLSTIDIIDEKYVFCSSEEIIPFLNKDILFLKRDSILDRADIKGMQIYKSFVGSVDADIYALMHATSPFLSRKTIETCIGKVAYDNYDSAFTAVKVQNFIWQNGKPNYLLDDIPRTQDIEPVYIETSGIYVYRKDVLIKYNRRIGDNPYICEISGKEAVDIDCPEDFELANAWIKMEETVESNR